MGVSAGLGMWLLFDLPQTLSATQLTLWMIGFGIFYVPYISLNADLTTSYEERTMLSTLRIFLEKLAGIVMGFVILLVFLANAPDFPDGRLRTRPVTQRWALWAVLLQSCQF